jgi:hypothetical protein
MAYDPGLEMRIDDILAERPACRARPLFGAMGWFCDGHLAVAVSGSDLIVRLAPVDGEAALEEPGTRPFAPGGRPFRGWVVVSPDATDADAGLRDWVERGWAFAAGLPPK